MICREKYRVLCFFLVCFFTASYISTSVLAIEPDTPKVKKIENVDQSIRNQYDFDHNDLSDVINQFLKKNNLSEKNCSISYLLSDGSLRYDFAEDVFRTEASTYKLPLNMYYYDLEREGKLATNAKIRGYTLDKIHRLSLVYSDNSVSQALSSNLGSYQHYRELMTQYCKQDYPDRYYHDNIINSAYMICVLERIYKGKDNYKEMIGYMKEANPGQYFENNDETVEIAHKYGSYNGALNDVGIVYTSTPYYLAVYTQNVPYAEKVLGNLCSLFTQYTEYYLWKQKAEAEKYVVPNSLIIPDDDFDDIDRSNYSPKEDKTIVNIVILFGIAFLAMVMLLRVIKNND